MNAITNEENGDTTKRERILKSISVCEVIAIQVIMNLPIDKNIISISEINDSFRIPTSFPVIQEPINPPKNRRKARNLTL